MTKDKDKKRGSSKEKKTLINLDNMNNNIIDKPLETDNDKPTGSDRHSLLVQSDKLTVEKYLEAPLTDRPPSDTLPRGFKYQVNDSRQLSTSSRPVMAKRLKSSTSDTSLPSRNSIEENPLENPGKNTVENTGKETPALAIETADGCIENIGKEGTTASEGSTKGTFEGGRKADEDVRRQLEDIRGSLEKIVIVVAQLSEKYC